MFLFEDRYATGRDWQRNRPKTVWNFQQFGNFLREVDFRSAGDFMKLDESDLDRTYFPNNAQRVDKSVGYVVIGLAVVLLCSLFVFGMNRIQTVSDQTVGGRSTPTNDRSAPDISDSRRFIRRIDAMILLSRGASAPGHPERIAMNRDAYRR